MKGLHVCAIAIILAIALQVAESHKKGKGNKKGNSHGYHRHRGHGYGHHKHVTKTESDWSDWGDCSVPCEGQGWHSRVKTYTEERGCDGDVDTSLCP